MRLEPKQKIVFDYMQEGLKRKEIAKLMNLKYSTVCHYWRMIKNKKRLSDSLEKKCS
jgi:DNA-binding NarL/FixJ family response regulator